MHYKDILSVYYNIYCDKAIVVFINFDGWVQDEKKNLALMEYENK